VGQTGRLMENAAGRVEILYSGGVGEYFSYSFRNN